MTISTAQDFIDKVVHSVVRGLCWIKKYTDLSEVDQIFEAIDARLEGARRTIALEVVLVTKCDSEIMYTVRHIELGHGRFTVEVPGELVGVIVTDAVGDEKVSVFGDGGVLLGPCKAVPDSMVELRPLFHASRLLASYVMALRAWEGKESPETSPHEVVSSRLADLMLAPLEVLSETIDRLAVVSAALLGVARELQFVVVDGILRSETPM